MLPQTDLAQGTVGSGRGQRWLIALVQVLGLSVWFSVSAVAPNLRADWGLGTGDLLWLTAAVQLGFVVGAVTSGVLNLPDRVPLPVLMVASTFAAAAATVGFVVWADGLGSGVVWRFVTGIFLAGIYPPGMKLMTTWAAPSDRGRAFGLLIACLTMGSALPYGVSGLVDLPWRTVVSIAAGIAVLGGVLAAAFLRTGPFAAPSSPAHPRHALAGFKERSPLMANLGYFGHMWELYAWWTWLPLFLTQAMSGSSWTVDPTFVAFLMIGVAGALGAVIGGRVADHYGRRMAAVGALAISGTCCLVSPALPVLPLALSLVVLVLWGASIIADSGVFSAALSETVDQRYIGTALTVQMAVGYLVTVVSIQIVAAVGETWGWQSALLILAIGPLIGASAMSLWRPAKP